MAIFTKYSQNNEVFREFWKNLKQISSNVDQFFKKCLKKRGIKFCQIFKQVLRKFGRQERKILWKQLRAIINKNYEHNLKSVQKKRKEKLNIMEYFQKKLNFYKFLQKFTKPFKHNLKNFSGNFKIVLFWENFEEMTWKFLEVRAES